MIDLGPFIRSAMQIANHIIDGRHLAPQIKLSGGIAPNSSSMLYSGMGAPATALGVNGDFYFRTDTPGTANQRLYVKSAGAWVGIL